MKPIVGTSTKMNLTPSEAGDYLHELGRLLADLSGLELFVLPPFTSIWQARETFRSTDIGWGAQDVHPEESGAHTGDISAAMLADLDCRYVECGHSERRRDHAESDALIAAKVAQVVRHRMVPVVCVGEERQESAIDSASLVGGQVRAALSLLPDTREARVIVAYEPVWAIGEGAQAAPVAHIAFMHAAIRDELDRLGYPEARVPIIYGGSVDAVTAMALVGIENVDGVFVGRAALQPTVFAAIAREFARPATGARAGAGERRSPTCA